jgi:hypothetical protein
MQRAGTNVFEGGAMLLVQAEAQGLFAIRIERDEVVVVVGAAMQDATAEVDGGIDERGRDAAILGLHVKAGVADLHIRVVAEQHGIGFRPGSAARGLKNIYFSEAFDRMRSNGYYNPSP